MESKILIDITPMGVPYLLIHNKITDDLRDKVLSRFIYETGADKENGAPLKLHILHNENGLVQAMIERPDSYEENGGKPTDEIIFKEKADKWLQKNLPHDLYKKWVDEVLYGKSISEKNPWNNAFKNLPPDGKNVAARYKTVGGYSYTQLRREDDKVFVGDREEKCDTMYLTTNEMLKHFEWLEAPQKSDETNLEHLSKNILGIQ